MTTLAEHIIVAGAENCPPMLEKSMYDSWASLYPTVEEDGQTRLKKYSELTEAQQLQDDCDVQATNIILHGLPPDVYALVNHQEAAKDIWDKVKLLMKGTELSYQERECRLYNLFDKFAFVQGETLYEYYWRFSQLINDMHTIGMTMQQVQVNTKFLNALPPEWSKFVTDVKLAKSLYTTNYDQLYAYLSQHERHANEVRIMRERYPDPLALVANSQTLYNPSQSPQHSVLQCIHPQQFTPVYVEPIHHQHHHTPVNPQQQSVSPQPFISPIVTQQSQAKFHQLVSGLVATIQDGRVTVQQIQERKNQSFVGTRKRGIATTSRRNYAGGQAKVVKCYNCLGEGHTAKQCTQPKRPRNSAWFKEKLMLVEAQEAGQILDSEQLAFHKRPGIEVALSAHRTILRISFQI
ncbi:reverse transcriptase domain-containing protein [Tanacetum coccineum]|uniref:Reverse transcriptase domain-containing protein n=1 Tax=Tanacetum coccineum TaxID=301880 RepID=A0ABQ5CSI9_9ASTR